MNLSIFSKLKPYCTFVLMIFLCKHSQAEPRYTDTIDPNTQFQTVDYFSASDAWTMQQIGSWSIKNKQNVADLLFSRDKGIGLSGWRFNLTAGVEHEKIPNSWRTGECFETSQGVYDWTRCANQRWFLAAAKQRGVNHFIAFCNSPPARLTVNGRTSIDKSSSVTSNLIPGMEKQYGAYLGDILSHFHTNPESAEQIDFDWISPINEPQWDWTGGQEGTRDSNQDILKQLKALASEIANRHLLTHILGPESGSIPGMYSLEKGPSAHFRTNFGNYIDLLCSDSALGGILNYTLAYHSYWSDSKESLLANRKRLKAKLDQYPQWHAMESEYCIMEPGRDVGMNAALRLIRIAQADLTIVNSTGWSWWLAVSNANYKDGLLYTDWKRPGDAENIISSKMFWAFGNLSRFVRPGMVRIAIKSTADVHDLNAVYGSAYLDRITGQIVLVYSNSTDRDVSLNLSVHQNAAVGWMPYVTSEKPEDNLRACPVVAPSQAILLPARSVMTLVSTR